MNDLIPGIHMTSNAHPASTIRRTSARLAQVLAYLFGSLLVWKLLAAGIFDGCLEILCLACGGFWLLGALTRGRRENGSAAATGQKQGVLRNPSTLKEAKRIFAFSLALLLWRSLGLAAFNIPSDSMMPTLSAGDFILVNKAAYGLRLPGLPWALGRREPHRGDVVVFHPPFRTSQYWIKRVVGLPGDRIEIRHDQIRVNGIAAPFKVTGSYNDGCYQNLEIATEILGGHSHRVLRCPVPLQLTPSVPRSCPLGDSHGLLCGTSTKYPTLRYKAVTAMTVPKGEYLMIGDNRDNSDDGRFWGFVPQKDLVGKAVLILFNAEVRHDGPTPLKWVGRVLE